MIDQDFMRFEQRRDGVVISVSVSVDSALPDTLEAFRSFLLAVGYSAETVREVFEGAASASEAAPGTGASR